VGCQPRSPFPKKSVTADIIRVALGSKILHLDCSATFNLKDCLLSIKYKTARRRSSRNSVGSPHDAADPLLINLRDLMELKYFVPKADEEVDERDVSNFFSLRIKPNRRNGLAVFPNCYKPDSDELRHKYIVMEFRYEKQLEEMRNLMLQHETLQVFISEESRLDSVEAKDYCFVLQAATDKEAQNRPIKSPLQPISTFLLGKKPKEVLLVYPFNGDAKEIDNAAEGLNELEEPSSDADLESVDNTNDILLKADPSSEKENEDEDTNGKKTQEVPEESRAELELTTETFERLDNGVYLNDTLIDFWCNW
jgi:hypothetical protein